MSSTIKNIAVFGVGAAGSNTALHLVYTYPALNITVIDDDIVEDRNIDPGTQPYTKTDLRRPKVQGFQRIAMMAKNKKVAAVKKRINTVKDIMEIVIPHPDEWMIIDAFDNAPSRNLFTQLKGKTNVLHIGFSASLSGEAVWDGMFEPMEVSKKDAEIDVCEMALARPFIFALSSMAAIAISRFIEKGEKTNLYLDTQFRIKSW